MARRTPGIGVLGCGTIARFQHLPNLRRMRGARLVAAADADAATRRRIARRFALPVYASAEELLAHPGVDALVIASPTPLHAEHALQAIAAGKPFYLEKPMATDRAEAERVLAAAATAGVAGCVGFNYRFQPLGVAARALVARGALAGLRAVRGLFCEPLAPEAGSGWRARRESGGGVWLDLGSHHVDLVRWLTGEELVAVESASVESRRGEQDGASARFRLAGGTEVHLLLRYGPGPVDRIELVGERAVLTLDRHGGTLRLAAPRRWGYGARARSAALGAVARLRLRRLVQPSWEPSFARALRAFAGALADGGPDAKLATLADGAAALAAVLAAEQAARTGGPVEIERCGGG
jgi:predicted dehydrogenase